jgi:hypothetical protein
MPEGLSNKGFETKDSLQTFDYSNDLYTIRNPNSPLSSRPMPLGMDSKDVLVNMQEQLERQAEEQFLRGNFRFATDKLFIIGRIGKYIFLAVMLPPYILLYGIPKWLIVDALPLGASLFSQAFKQISQIIINIAESIQAQLLNLGKILSISKGESQRNAGEDQIGNSKRSIDDWVMGILTSAASKIKNQLLKPFKALKNASARLFFSASAAVANWINQTKDYVNLKMQSVLADVKTQINNGLEILQKSLIQPLLSWSAPKIASADQAFKDAAERIAKISDNVREWTANSFETIKEFAVWPTQFIQPAFAWSYSGAENIAAFAIKIQRKAIEKIGNEAQRLKTTVQEMGRAISQATQQGIFIAWNGLIQFPQYSAQMVSKKALKWLKNFKKFGREAARHFHRFSNACAEKILKIQEKFGSLLEGCLKGIQHLIAYLGRLFFWLLNGIYHFPRMALKFLQKAFIAAGDMIGKTVKGLFLLKVWTKILFGYGMQLVREVADELGKYLRSIFNKA